MDISPFLSQAQMTKMHLRKSDDNNQEWRREKGRWRREMKIIGWEVMVTHHTDGGILIFVLFMQCNANLAM